MTANKRNLTRLSKLLLLRHSANETHQTFTTLEDVIDFLALWVNGSRKGIGEPYHAMFGKHLVKVLKNRGRWWEEVDLPYFQKSCNFNLRLIVSEPIEIPVHGLVELTFSEFMKPEDGFRYAVFVSGTDRKLTKFFENSEITRTYYRFLADKFAPKEVNPVRLLKEQEEIHIADNRGRAGIDTFYQDLRHGKQDPPKKEVMAWKYVGDVCVVGKVRDLEGLGILDRSLKFHSTTDEYYTDARVIIKPPVFEEGCWFDESDTVTLYAETKEDFIDLYKVMRANERYGVTVELDPEKEEELLKLMLGLDR